MTVEVGGAGTLGVGLETTLGTYAVPTKWIPIRSENLAVKEDKIYRTNIRGVADRSGAIQGYTHTEGDITFEISPDILVYFMYAMRVTATKTGASAPFTYLFTPAHVAKATTATGTTTRKTLSLLIARSGNPMAYTGCSVGQLSITTDNGLLMATASMIGTAQSAQSAGTPTYVSGDVVVGPGDVTLELPSATARSDADTATLVINDNLTTANRLNGSRSAAYQNWGEREVTLSFEADFDTLTDYNAFTAQTIQAAKLKGVVTAAVEEFTATLNATAIDSYETGLSSLGDVNRAAVAMHAFYNTSAAYTMQVITAESIT